MRILPGSGIASKASEIVSFGLADLHVSLGHFSSREAREGYSDDG